jgi:hypothetical protein
MKLPGTGNPAFWKIIGSISHTQESRFSAKLTFVKKQWVEILAR